MFTYRLGFVAILLTGIGCASASSPASAGQQASAPRSRSDLITAEELADPSVSTGDAMQAVKRLKPQFLLTRGAASASATGAGSVHISVNGGSLQTVDFLSRLRANEILEIRYLSTSDAAQRFGTAAESGPVLLVKTK